MIMGGRIQLYYFTGRPCTDLDSHPVGELLGLAADCWAFFPAGLHLVPADFLWGSYLATHDDIVI